MRWHGKCSFSTRLESQRFSNSFSFKKVVSFVVVASTADYAALNHSLAPTQSQPNRRKLSTLVWTKSRYRARIRDTTNTTIMCEGGALLPSQKTTRSRNSEIEFCWRRQTDNCSTGRPLSHEFFKVLILPFQLCIVDSFSISVFTVRQELIYISVTNFDWK